MHHSPYSSDQFWLAELKALIAADTPVILLMTYEPNGGGGHYRTVIGYDDRKWMIYFSYPWGRDQKHQTDKTGITAWTYEGTIEKSSDKVKAGYIQPKIF